jgi:hypothetical protein
VFLGSELPRRRDADGESFDRVAAEVGNGEDCDLMRSFSLELAETLLELSARFGGENPRVIGDPAEQLWNGDLGVRRGSDKREERDRGDDDPSAIRTIRAADACDQNLTSGGVSSTPSRGAKVGFGFAPMILAMIKVGKLRTVVL